jgi:RimJ/RimL family protein N-acetyltransferase
MSSQSIISTQRLSLVRLEEQHADAFFSYRSNPEVTKFLTWTADSIEQVQDFIAGNPAEMGKAGTWFQVAIVQKPINMLIGDLGVHFKKDKPSECELGYTLIPEYRGKGYASEALSAVISFLFSSHSVERITCSVDPHNVASIRLLEKLGFNLEAVYPKSYLFRGQLVDDAVYSVQKHDWEREE